MLVKDLMTANVMTISPEASLTDIGKILKEKRISGLPVTDQNGNLVGVVTLTDLLRILNRIYKWKGLERRDGLEPKFSDMFEHEKASAKVSDIMTKSVVTLSVDDALDDVMRIMFENQIHTIPVTEEGRIVGVIGKRDLITACF